MKVELKHAQKPRSAVADNAPETLNDVGNKDRFVRAFRDVLAYVPEKGVWREWNGERWSDNSGAPLRAAEQVARSLFDYLAKEGLSPIERELIFRHAQKTSSLSGLNNMIKLAETSEVEDRQERWDLDPILLGVRNGIIDLRTGELLNPDPTKYISKYSPVTVDPDARCPQWRTFLKRIMPDVEMRKFLRRAAGYSMLGRNAERVLFECYGVGANGKSKFLEALEYAMGEYSIATPPATLMVKRSSGVPNDVARLAGARLVTSIETDKGGRLSEALVKSLTGEDRISARHLFKEFFDFTPVAKIWIATNHKPEVRGTDAAIWDRILLIPFAVVIPRAERDLQLGNKLRAEAAGIFNWMLRGCMEWHDAGLQVPDSVRAATQEYRESMDVVGRWLQEQTVAARDSVIQARGAYKDYCTWAEEGHETILSQRAFGEEITRRGIAKKTTNKGVQYRGLQFKE